MLHGHISCSFNICIVNSLKVLSGLLIRNLSLIRCKCNIGLLKHLLIVFTLLSTTMPLNSLGISFLDFKVLANLVLFALLLKLGRLWIAISSLNLIDWLICFLIKTIGVLWSSVSLLLILWEKLSTPLISTIISSILLINHCSVTWILEGSCVVITSR